MPRYEGSADLLRAIYYLFPNLETFNFRAYAVHDLAIPTSSLLYAMAYGAAYCTALLCLAVLIFSKRNFK